MSQAQHNTNSRACQHLNSAEHKVIQRLNHHGKSTAEIGRTLRRNRSTISRELKRGSVAQRKLVQSYCKRIEVPLYTETIVDFADAGERECRKRRAATGAKCHIGECLPFITCLEEKMLGQEKWSPDAVARERASKTVLTTMLHRKRCITGLIQGCVVSEIWTYCAK